MKNLQNIILILTVKGLTLSMIAPQEVNSGSQVITVRENKKHIPNKFLPYVGVEAAFSFFNSETESKINQYTDLFQGKPLLFQEKNFQSEFVFESSNIKRSYTGFVPDIFLGIKTTTGSHTFFSELHFAGIIPLNTLEAEQEVTLKETSCPNECGLQNAGFVSSSGSSNYTLNTVLNEDILLVSPRFGYEYTLPYKVPAQWYVGGAAGGVYLSTRQKLEFSASNQETTVLKTLEGYVSSTASGFGFTAEIYAKLEMPFYNKVFSKLGIRYTLVPLIKENVGSMNALLDGIINASASSKEMGFAEQESVSFSAFSIFWQGGIVF